MNNQNGFISAYFLSVFLSITILVTVICLNTSNRLKSMENIASIQQYVAQENDVVSHIKCDLLNEELEDGTYSASFSEYAIQVEGDRIVVTILEPLYEVFELEYRNEDPQFYGLDVIETSGKAQGS